MKSIIFSIAFLCLFTLPTAAMADQHGGYSNQNIHDLDTNHNGQWDQGEVDPCCAYRCGPCICYCPVTKFKPQYYKTCRCEYETYNCYKRCCRYNPQYYECTHCRYVPQYYKTTHCRQVPEYYYTCEEKCRPKYVYDCHCRYCPYTCWEKSCVDQGCQSCADQGCQTCH